MGGDNARTASGEARAAGGSPGAVPFVFPPWYLCSYLKRLVPAAGEDLRQRLGSTSSRCRFAAAALDSCGGWKALHVMPRSFRFMFSPFISLHVFVPAFRFMFSPFISLHVFPCISLHVFPFISLHVFFPAFRFMFPLFISLHFPCISLHVFPPSFRFISPCISLHVFPLHFSLFSLSFRFTFSPFISLHFPPFRFMFSPFISLHFPLSFRFVFSPFISPHDSNVKKNTQTIIRRL